MGVSRGTESAMVSERAQSTLIGIVLLLGMVAIGSLGIFLVAGDAISSTEQQSEQEQVQQTFVELSHGISTATASDDVSHSLELEAGEHGAIAHHDSATYKIWSQDYTGENRTNISDGTIGTVEYENDDGTKIAYEGGGVFHETGERTRVVSAPAINYDGRTSTLSFPVVTLTEEKTLRSGDIQLARTDVKPEQRNYVANDHVFTEVESEYCLGWEEYFVEQAGDMSIQQACYGAENDDGKLKVRLGYDEISNAFSSGVALSDNDIGGKDQHNPFGDAESAEYPPIDDIVYELTEDFESNESVNDLSTISGDPGSGKYYTDEIKDTDLEFNLSEGDAVLAVNGSIDTSSADIAVSDCGPDGDSQLKIYATGNLAMHDGTIAPDCDEGGSIKTIQVYGTSEMGIDFHSSPEFEGLLYAASDKDPNSDFEGWSVEESQNNRDDNYQVNFQGGTTFEGSIIAHSINIDSNVDDVEAISLEDSNVDVIPEGYEQAPQLTYLNLAEHKIDIKND